MKKLSNAIRILGIGIMTSLIIGSAASAATITIPSSAADDGMLIPGVTCSTAVPKAGDTDLDDRIIGRLVFDLAAFPGGDITDAKLNFRVLAVDGTPFLDLGNLEVRVHGWNFNICNLPPLGTYIMSLPGPGAITLGSASPNYWTFRNILENACYGGSPALIVTFNFPAPTDGMGDRDAVIIPSVMADLHIEYY